MTDTEDEAGDIRSEETNRVPLLRAARRLRIEAIDMIPQLVAQLQSAAEEHLAKTDKAKKFAESIKNQ